MYPNGDREVTVGYYNAASKRPGAFMVFHEGPDSSGEKYYVTEKTLGCCLIDIVGGVRIKADWEWDGARGSYTCHRSGVIIIREPILYRVVRENWTAAGHRECTFPTPVHFCIVHPLLNMAGGTVVGMVDEFPDDVDEPGVMRSPQYVEFRAKLALIPEPARAHVRTAHDLTREIVLRVSTVAGVRNLWIELQRAVDISTAKLMYDGGIQALSCVMQKVENDGPPYLWRIEEIHKPWWHRGTLLTVKDCDALTPLLAGAQCAVCTFADARRARETFDSLDECKQGRSYKHEMWHLCDRQGQPLQNTSPLDTEWLLTSEAFRGTHASFDFAVECTDGQLSAFHVPSRRDSAVCVALTNALVCPAPAAWSDSVDRLPPDALSAEQSQALRGMLRSKFAMMDAGAGRGKSHLLLKLTACMTDNQTSFIVAAMQHKHLSRLRQDVPNLHVTTLHALAITVRHKTPRRVGQILRRMNDPSSINGTGPLSLGRVGDGIYREDAYQAVLNVYRGFNPSVDDEGIIRSMLDSVCTEAHLLTCCKGRCDHRGGWHTDNSSVSSPVSSNEFHVHVRAHGPAGADRLG